MHTRLTRKPGLTPQPPRYSLTVANLMNNVDCPGQDWPDHLIGVEPASHTESRKNMLPGLVFVVLVGTSIWGGLYFLIRHLLWH